MSWPLRVSVIIPTYNRESYIARAIESALDQGEVEVIVVDDGSTDNTQSVVERDFGERVRYVWQANQREGAARNNGVRHASGNLLAFLDSDDYWLPGKLDADVDRFARDGALALVYSRAINVDPQERVLGSRALASPQGNIFWALARESFVPLSTVVVRSDRFRACGGFVEDPDLSGTADWELWMRLVARWAAGFVDQTTTCIRVHPRNMLSDPAWMERAMLAGVRHALADPGVAERVGSRQSYLWAHMYVTIALNAYANAHRRRGAGWLLRAIRAWPAVVGDPRFLGAAARMLAGRSAVDVIRTVVPRTAAA